MDEAKKKELLRGLIMTAIQCVQYVTEGKTYLKDNDITEQEAAMLCNEVTEPMWERFRGCK